MVAMETSLRLDEEEFPSFIGGQPMCRAYARSDPGTRASGGGVGRPNKW